MMIDKHTPGPWRWEFNEKHRQLTLVGGRPKYDLTIMEFCRWGMWGAGVSMRDTSPDADEFNLMYKVHERPDWVVAFPGREHHKNWCAGIDHPDMRLMQSAPELLEALALCLIQLEKEHMPSDEVMHAMHHARAAICKAVTAEGVAPC